MGRALALVSLWVWFAAPAFASGPVGGLRGVVTSERDGLQLHRVSVTLRSETTPQVEFRSTNPDGVFEFLDLPAGLYSLETRREGFAPTLSAPLLVIGGRLVVEHLELDRVPNVRRATPVLRPAT